MVHISSALPPLLEQVLGSGADPHLFDDLLVQAGPLILQFAPSGLGKRVTTLRGRGRGRRQPDRLGQTGRLLLFERSSHQVCPRSVLAPVHT